MKNNKDKVGKTALSRLKYNQGKNGNYIFMKEEYTNSPAQNHYDRVYKHLFEYYENKGLFVKGKTPLVETTSGNAGTSFAFFAREYGNPCTVILPNGVPATRVSKIKELGAEVIISEGSNYLKDASRTLKKFLVKNRKKGNEYFCFNHSKTSQSYKALAGCTEEIISQLEENNQSLDYFICALGNGTTLKGIGKPLKDRFPSLKIIGFEPYQAPSVLDKYYPGEFKKRYGEEPSFKRSDLIGTGVWGINFPNIDTSLLDEIIHVREWEWKDTSELLWETEYKPVGRTSAAAVKIALRLSETVENKNILVILYDNRIYYPDR